MFLTILQFELKYWLKNWSFYVYLAVFFVMALLSMAGAAGAFGEGSAASDHIPNSPLSIYNFTKFFNKFLLFLLPAIVGSTIYKDFKSNFNNILFTYPFSKTSYLFAKFTSSFFIVSIIAIFVELGLFLGTKLPFTNAAQLLPFDATVYLQTYFIFLIPNLFLFGTVVFATVLISRNIYVGFISIILLWLFSEIVTRIAGFESMTSFLIEPFGDNTIQFITRHWTLSEQNTLPLVLQPIVFYNRMVWLLVSIIVFTICYRWFSFSQNPISISLRTKKSTNLTKDNFGSIIRINLFKAKFNFTFLQYLKASWNLSQVDFIFILKSGSFMSIAIAGVLFLTAILLQTNPQTDTKTLPVTWVILGLPVLFYSFIVQILTYLYAGILVHRAKHSRFSDLISVTAVPNWVLAFSKFLALVKMQLVLLFLVMLVGLLIQISKAYYQFEIGHYLFDLFAIHLIGFIIWAFISLWVQSMFRNTYLSLFLLILGTLGISQLPYIGAEKFVFRFNESPDSTFFLKYSDLNGYGHSLRAFFLYKFYWFIFGMILFCLTLLLWPRELTNTVYERFKIAKNRFRGKLALITTILLAGFMCFGFYLYQLEIKDQNMDFSENNKSNLLVQFQKQYKIYEHIQQPRITSVFVKLDIFPESNSFMADGKYTLVNKTNQIIDTLMIKTGFDEMSRIHFDLKASLIQQDSIFKFGIYKLDKGIAPKDSITLRFSVTNQKNTLLTQYSNILKNGTYLKSDILPRLGYFANTEIKKPNDSSVLSNHYQSIDADFVDFEAILSTTENQTAITSGLLLKEWTEKGRRYFHYKMDKPIKFVLGFNFGEYAVLNDNYKGLGLRIYYHPTHSHCLGQMMDGLKSAFDYNTTNFGAYQHKQVQIIEFPRSEGSYATTSGNCIQVSEMRFINDVNNSKSSGIDLSFYVAAHEFTHQWWGNQVIPADALGATMITESITEYITAKIYEKKFGKQSALKFLKIQRTRYLSGRTSEPGNESPLYLVNPEQSYISYGKGAIALYTLSEYLGEDKLNKTLQDYLNKVKFKPALYTTSLELLHFLKKVTPDHLHYLITDMFETIDKDKTLLYFDKIMESYNEHK